MKLISKCFSIYLWIIVFFILFMSIDVFELEGSLFDKLIGFLIHASPGIVLALILLFAKEIKVKSILLFTLSIGCILLFNPFKDISNQWFILVFLILPLLSSSIFYGITSFIIPRS